MHKSASGPSKTKRRPARTAGLKLKEYTIGRTIGEGTFGKVKQATHRSTGTKVAIKIIDKRRIVKSSDRKRVVKEIKILKRLQHPHVIQLHEVVDSRKYIFLIMDYVPRGELFDYIVKHGRLMEWQACRFFHQLIGAVAYFHNRGVVHRDLKPENILLDEKLCIKICDFGLGNVNTKDGIFKTACGSPCYVAPEMISGGHYNGPGVDIWACGVILYAMLCGFLPFEDNGSLSELYDLIFEAKYEVPSFLSKDALDLISNVLVVDPKKRYTAKMIRRHRWYRMLPDTAESRKTTKIINDETESKAVQSAMEELISFYSTDSALGSPKNIPSSGRKGKPKHRRTHSGHIQNTSEGVSVNADHQEPKSPTFLWALSPTNDASKVSQKREKRDRTSTKNIPSASASPPADRGLRMKKGFDKAGVAATLVKASETESMGFELKDLGLALPDIKKKLKNTMSSSEKDTTFYNWTKDPKNPAKRIVSAAEASRK
mmetsp:Transcript_1270/g.2956  ORF Transcript_1270/g.2956 Transcript_1270/m.2956 type:complete len:487 (-) Transcript_1270:155-1615(-)|eukprot:CAMPEP_0114515170 /NCGR_PEP_ID=MMETSP0109-20121206/16576_1 /TAXON_ID=29199 /ORGANISM="Chlorarachnion reptans, Strain CCCM449" /LENGTH=486 /DNA_ID=CAMNT_0001695323 /DNA_START=2105 /DNA_END=3565 /DNA_ORIENTATION=+